MNLFLRSSLFNTLLSVVGIIVFAPIMLITAVHIKLVSPEGPLLADMKDRVGKAGKLFRMFKFRSMIPNAQKWLESQPELYKKYQENGYKLDNDPRWLKGANFMRATSIDELPQFFNILLGDMSLVGPRAYFAFELEERIREHPDAKALIDQALEVKPGLTGVWQTSGRSNISFPARVQLDADYAKKRSLLYDLIIILKTPYVVLTRKGAF